MRLQFYTVGDHGCKYWDSFGQKNWWTVPQPVIRCFILKFQLLQLQARGFQPLGDSGIPQDIGILHPYYSIHSMHNRILCSTYRYQIPIEIPVPVLERFFAYTWNIVLRTPRSKNQNGMSCHDMPGGAPQVKSAQSGDCWPPQHETNGEN